MDEPATTPQGPKVDEWEASFRGDEYVKALADNRVLRWHPIATVPDDRFVIVGRNTDHPDPSWVMRRVKVKARLQMTVQGRQATHWCEDILGTPTIVVSTGRG